MLRFEKTLKRVLFSAALSEQIGGLLLFAKICARSEFPQTPECRPEWGNFARPAIARTHAFAYATAHGVAHAIADAFADAAADAIANAIANAIGGPAEASAGSQTSHHQS